MLTMTVHRSMCDKGPLTPFRPFACYRQPAGGEHFDCLRGGLDGEGQSPPPPDSCNLDGENGTLAMAWLQGVRDGRTGMVDAR
jgi:hypothetical protein